MSLDQPPIPPRDLAATVRAEVARRRLPQAQIAAHLGLSQRAVSRRLTGEVAWSGAEVQRLAIVLGVPAAQLLGEVPA